MRKTFRTHPKLTLKHIEGYRYGCYDSLTNNLSLTVIENEVLECLIHELTHWAMTGFFDKKELKKNDELYVKLRNKLDGLTFNKESIEERTAIYVEELLGETDED